MLRMKGNKTCRTCIYFDPDTSMCQADTLYETTSPRHSACKSYASDEEDYDTTQPYSGDDLFDEDNYYIED